MGVQVAGQALGEPGQEAAAVGGRMAFGARRRDAVGAVAFGAAQQAVLAGGRLQLLHDAAVTGLAGCGRRIRREDGLQRAVHRMAPGAVGRRLGFVVDLVAFHAGEYPSVPVRMAGPAILGRMGAGILLKLPLLVPVALGAG